MEHVIVPIQSLREKITRAVLFSCILNLYHMHTHLTCYFHKFEETSTTKYYEYVAALSSRIYATALTTIIYLRNCNYMRK